MTALREHLAVLRSSMQRTEHWDTLGERVRGCTGGSCRQGRRQCDTPEVCQVAERAEERADAGAWFAAIVIVALMSAVLFVHFRSL